VSDEAAKIVKLPMTLDTDASGVPAGRVEPADGLAARVGDADPAAEDAGTGVADAGAADVFAAALDGTVDGATEATALGAADGALVAVGLPPHAASRVTTSNGIRDKRHEERPISPPSSPMLARYTPVCPLRIL
jgi:hypothetical protein